MAGLLGNGPDDPRSAAVMALAGGLLRGDFGGGLLGSQQAFSQARQQAIQNQMLQMQMQQQQMQLEKAKREQSIEQQMQEAARQHYVNPLQAEARSMGPTPDGGTVPQVAPGFDAAGYGQRLFGIDPMKGLAFQQAMAKETPFGKVDPKDFTPASVRAFQQSGGKDFGVLVPRSKKEVGPGGQVYDPYAIEDGRVLADPNKPFAIGQGGSLVPNLPFQQYETNKARAGAARMTMINKQEGEEAKAVGKFFGENYADVQKAGLTAQSSINRIDRLGQLLEGVDTGKFAPLGVEVAKIAQAAGMNIDPKLANKEAAVALSSEIALQLRNPSGGAGMPGAMSDADRNFLAGMVPGIEKTPEGRKMIIATAKKIAQRDVEVARMAREYRQKTGTINEGFYDRLAQHSEANPLFGGAMSTRSAPDIDALLRKYGK